MTRLINAFPVEFEQRTRRVSGEQSAINVSEFTSDRWLNMLCAVARQLLYVEERDNLDLAGKPMVVDGPRDRASYEARTFA
jgi:hypothetical protein